MDGPNSTSGNIPGTTSHPVTPSQPPSESQSGVNPLDGQRYTPEPGSRPATVPVHMRTPVVQKGVLPKVNRQKTIDQLQSSYKAHYARAEALRDQLDLACSLKEIRHYLDNPALAKECTGYSILWIPDEGEPVSVIPPGTELNDRSRAAEIRGMLHNQLDKLSQKFTVPKLQQLEEKIGEQEGLMKVTAQQLNDMGALLPGLPPRERIVFLGGTSAKGAPVTGQPSTSQPLSQAGQRAPSSTEATSSLQSLESEEVSQLPGRFELRLKKPGTKSFQPVTKEHDFLADSEDGDIPVTRQQPPETRSPLTPPFISENSIEKEEALPGSSGQQQRESSPLIQFEEEQDDDFSPFSQQSTPPDVTSSRPQKYEPYSPEFARPRPKVKKTAPKVVGPLPATPFEEEPEYSVSFIPAPGNGQPVNIFLRQLALDTKPMASVNPGSQGLGLADESRGDKDKTGLQFTKVLSRRAAPDEYARFHKKMLTKCDLHHTYDATEDDLADSPGLAASRVLKADFNSDGKNTGTIIIDVFKDKFPNKNSDNLAMIYVVPPDAEDYDDPHRFLADCEETARRLTWTLHTYNMGVRQLHKEGKGKELAEIQTLRTGAFGADQTKFPDIPPALVADLITRGITYQLGTIKKDGDPETIQQVELEDTGGVFSKQNTSPPPPPVFQPAVTVTPQKASISAPVPPVPPVQHTPAPSPVALTLQHCTKEMATQLENNKQLLSERALNYTFGRSNKERPVDKAGSYTGPLHATRKAMLGRAMLNLHRKHAMDQNAYTTDALHLPDAALPVVELGVLLSTPNPGRIMSGNGHPVDASGTAANLGKVKVPADAAALVANATNGATGTNPNILDYILRDVEKMENMRNKAVFDIAELDTYQLLPDSQARAELVALCTEYRDLLTRHNDLNGGKTKRLQRRNKFRLQENGMRVGPEISSKLQPGFRANIEKVENLYLQQVENLRQGSKFAELYHYTTDD